VNSPTRNCSLLKSLDGYRRISSDGSTYSSMAGMKYSSRRSFLAKLSALAVASRVGSWASEPSSLLFAGTYTNDKGSTSQGIYAYRWDADAGSLELIGLAAATVNPSFLTLSSDRRHLYAVNEVDDYQGSKSGSVSSFAVEGASGKLKTINTVPSAGGGPCKITIDFTGRAAFVANYDGGSAASFRVSKKGALSKPVSIFQYTGHGANPERQAAPHTHCTTVSPDSRYVLVNDLGLDRISVYHLDPQTAQLTANDPPFYEALPGSGPRSFTFHPSGKWAYSLNEIANTVDGLTWDAGHGTLTRFQNISTLPEGFSGSNTAGTVAVDSAGRFLYASNRGDNSVAVFSISDGDGTLTAVQHVDCGGQTPRHFTLDPGNQWLLVANEDSSNIVVFARNTRSGLLTPNGKQYPLSHPVCLVFG
jgi:6-phosphogluconolactonase